MHGVLVEVSRGSTGIRSSFRSGRAPQRRVDVGSRGCDTSCNTRALGGCFVVDYAYAPGGGRVPDRQPSPRGVSGQAMAAETPEVVLRAYPGGSASGGAVPAGPGNRPGGITRPPGQRRG